MRLLPLAVSLMVAASYSTTVESSPSVSVTPPVVKLETKAFIQQPVDAEIINNKLSNLALSGYALKKNNEWLGTVYTPNRQRLDFKAYSSKDKTSAPDKLIIDWNNNKTFADDPILNTPIGRTTQTVTINGIEQKMVIAKYGSRGYNILIRNASWMRGKLEYAGKVYDAAIMDLDFNGIDSGGSDILLLDLDGDGKFSRGRKGYEGQMLLGKSVYRNGEFFRFSYNKETNRASLTSATDIGTLALALAPTMVNAKIRLRVSINGRYKSFPLKDNAIKLPQGTYSKASVNLSIKDGKKTNSISCRTTALNVKANETTVLNLEKPSKVVPTVRQEGSALKISETLVFDNAMNRIPTKMNFTVNEKRVPAPKITVFKGTKQLAQGTMKYG